MKTKIQHKYQYYSKHSEHAVNLNIIQCLLLLLNNLTLNQNGRLRHNSTVKYSQTSITQNSIDIRFFCKLYKETVSSSGRKLTSTKKEVHINKKFYVNVGLAPSHQKRDIMIRQQYRSQGQSKPFRDQSIVVCNSGDPPYSPGLAPQQIFQIFQRSRN